MPVAPAILAPRADDPDWLAQLRAEAAATSIAAAARRIDMARASVSLVLSGAYPAGLDRVEARVRAKLMDQVRCPAFGEDIAWAKCRAQAAKPFSAASSRAARLYRACQSCPHRPPILPHRPKESADD